MKLALKAWHRWCLGLPVIKESAHFAVHALLRNPKRDARSSRKRNRGVHGLRRKELVDHLLQHLELAWTRLISIGREPPLLPRSGKVPVYLFAVDDPPLHCGDPCTDQLFFRSEGQFLPVIALPARLPEPDLDDECDKLAACAVHEVEHVFNYRQLPQLRWNAASKIVEDQIALSRTWLWMNEGMAVAAEAEVLENIHDWFRYSLDWVDRPERSLETIGAEYQAVFLSATSRVW